MKYSEYEAYAQDPEKLARRLRNSGRNGKLKLLQDYYDGIHWNLQGNKQTRFTRSNREMWKVIGKNPFNGYTKGELKTWNVIKPAINVYAKYVRGVDNDDVKVIIKKGKNTDEELSNKATKMFDDLSTWVQDATRRGSISSVLVTKFTPLAESDDNGQYTREEREILRKIRLEDEAEMLEGMVELIDSKEIEPIYWNGSIRGMIRFYPIDKVEAKMIYGMKYLRSYPLYIEVWYIDDTGQVQLDKYVNDKKLEEESGVAPYDFIPYRIHFNRKRSDGKDYDIHNIEESDVEELVELQDDLNSFVTDLGVIYRQVAIPMLKLTDDFVKAAKQGDLDKVKKNLQEFTSFAGQILFGPIERMKEAGVSDSQVRFIMDIREQYYLITNIPKSVFNSEGLANIAAETLEHLFESLAKVVSEKRTYVAKSIIDNVKLFLINKGEYTKDVTIDVVWPSMLGTTMSERTKIINESFAKDIIPVDYALEQILNELGDGERYEELKGMLLDMQAKLKQEAETRMALETIRQQAGQPQITNPDLDEVNANTGTN